MTSTIPGLTLLMAARALALPPPAGPPPGTWTGPPPGAAMPGDELPESWLRASTVPAPTPAARAGRVRTRRRVDHRRVLVAARGGLAGAGRGTGLLWVRGTVRARSRGIRGIVLAGRRSDTGLPRLIRIAAGGRDVVAGPVPGGRPGVLVLRWLLLAAAALFVHLRHPLPGTSVVPAPVRPLRRPGRHA